MTLRPLKPNSSKASSKVVQELAPRIVQVNDSVLDRLDDHFQHQSYVSDNIFSPADSLLYLSLEGTPPECSDALRRSHLKRWMEHIKGLQIEGVDPPLSQMSSTKASALVHNILS
eukprot:TRINITY_DN2064_c0_g2_i1.p1 TRINITY_DN2064_c0_g2~~TRINITY_DN2064_c0_g2_i1.p1  ORF type:complete len:115 (+),score=12.33 TRINITY_DN2064_c0_g2_i1:545-889(+)